MTAKELGEALAAARRDGTYADIDWAAASASKTFVGSTSIAISLFNYSTSIE